MPSDRSLRRPPGLKSFLLLIFVAVALGVVMGAAIGLLRDTSAGEGVIGHIVRAAVIAVGLAVGVLLCVRWWSALDEAAREAHKWAWFWGGSGGMTVGLLLLTTLSFSEPERWPGALGETAPDAFAMGVMAILLFQLAGYALAWAWWWLKRR